jgi:hypothetical protein
MINNTINGLSINVISAMFIAKINEPGVQDLQDDFFIVHDCLHWFTGLGVSVAEETLIKEIQFFMQGLKPSSSVSPIAQIHIISLKRRGVYDELCAALKESHANMMSNFAA